MKAFIESQFSYCPLVWMYHNRTLNNRINKIHERALRFVYKDNDTSFDALLNRDRSMTIHHRNLQQLAIEMFKVKNNLSPSFMHDIFVESKPNYNLRTDAFFETKNIRTVAYGSEMLSYRGSQLWEQIPSVIKNACSLIEFKRKIKLWKPVDCKCRMCKIFIPNLGFLE